MTKKFLIICLALFLVSACLSTTYHKKKFKKFNPRQTQNHLIKKNGYYFYETEICRYSNFIKPERGAIYPTDSILKTAITGILFYNNNKVYITSYFDGLEHKKANSLQVAQNKLENRIHKFDLKTIDKKNTHISTLGKYAIHQDTITIQYFRFSHGEFKGILNTNNNSFNLFQKTDFNTSLFAKSKPKKINRSYRFKKY